MNIFETIKNIFIGKKKYVILFIKRAFIFEVKALFGLLNYNVKNLY